MNESRVATETEAQEEAQATAAPVALHGLSSNGKPSTMDRLRQLAATKAPYDKKVLFPEPYKDIDWYLRRGSVNEREQWERENTIRKNGRDQMQKENVRANLLIKSSVTVDGAQMFQPNKESREFINKLPADLVEYVFDETLDLWGIKKKDAEEIEAGNS